MQDFKVVARRSGDSVEFEVSTENIKEALKVAKAEASQIFGYEGLGDAPAVSIKPIKEKE